MGEERERVRDNETRRISRGVAWTLFLKRERGLNLTHSNRCALCAMAHSPLSLSFSTVWGWLHWYSDFFRLTMIELIICSFELFDWEIWGDWRPGNWNSSSTSFLPPQGRTHTPLTLTRAFKCLDANTYWRKRVLNSFSWYFLLSFFFSDVNSLKLNLFKVAPEILLRGKHTPHVCIVFASSDL